MPLRTSAVHSTEKDLQTLHGLAFMGLAKPTPYRDGQNVIRDGASGRIVYMPPQAEEVPVLMAELVQWINTEIKQNELPIPVLAALAHYQFATIHPYYDGDGRTARLLTGLILHRCGYGLKGLYSLEEYYARNLSGYYAALTVGPGHNYHSGRAQADVSGFVAYFRRRHERRGLPWCEPAPKHYGPTRQHPPIQAVRIAHIAPAATSSARPVCRTPRSHHQRIGGLPATGTPRR